MVSCNRFVFKCFVPNTRLLLKTRTYKIVDFTVLTYFKFYDSFTVINSLTIILLAEAMYKLRTIKCSFTLSLHMYVLG